MNPTADPTKPKKLRRVDLAQAIYRKIRCEKSPPIARYASLLTLAAADGPLTAYQIGIGIGEQTAVTGTLDSCARHAFIAPAGIAENGARLWRLTPKGNALVAELINPPTD